MVDGVGRSDNIFTYMNEINTKKKYYKNPNNKALIL